MSGEGVVGFGELGGQGEFEEVRGWEQEARGRGFEAWREGF